MAWGSWYGGIFMGNAADFSMASTARVTGNTSAYGAGGIYQNAGTTKPDITATNTNGNTAQTSGECNNYRNNGLPHGSQCVLN